MTLAEARLQALLKLIPAIQIFSLVDAVLLSWYFWTDISPLFLVGWTIAIAVHGALWWAVGHRMRDPQGAKPGRGRWFVLHAVTEAALFSVFSIVVFPQVGPEKAIVLGAFVTGLLAAGALSKMSMREAAYGFIVSLTLGSGVAFALSTLPSLWVVETLLVAFGFALGVLVTEMSRVFDGRVAAEHELVRQKALVSDLLDDFGESANEGLWETDPRGRLTLVTPRLATLAQTTAEALRGSSLVAGPQWNQLIDNGVAFRNVEVPLDAAQGRRWWSLTGKPLVEGSVIRGWRGVASDVTDHRHRELEMLRLGRFDGLTGLLNRRSFRALVDDLFEGTSVPGQRGLVLIDIVGFRDVNESRGHAFGDALLTEVANRLRKSVPEGMVLARLDGDEFALEGEVATTVENTVDQLRSLLDHLTEVYWIDGDRFEAGFRMGIAFTPDHASTPDQWLRCTDLALRSAKVAGRNRIVAYELAMMASFRETNLLREALRSARRAGELHLEYQPLVNLSDGRVTGFEALARWNHPSRGAISPEVFIPLAEESEVILDMGLWVLEEACRAARDWPHHITISVNVSGVQLRSNTLADDVASILHRVGFAPHRLLLEVTESALVQDAGNLLQTFFALKERGIRWVLDDFGTGYSSLSYLQDFPFDQLKIDQSFVRPHHTRQPSVALLGAIVSLAKALDLTTTAEGIEDQAHLDLLRSLGCDKGQGYLFSRPVSASKATELLGLEF